MTHASLGWRRNLAGPGSAELRRAEVRRLHADAAKLESEARETERKHKGWWVEALAKPIVTSAVAAAVAGFATWKFGLDAAVTLNELNEKTRMALEAEGRRVKVDAEKAQATADALRLQFAVLEEAVKDKAARVAITEAATSLSATQRDSGQDQWFSVFASTYSLEDAKRHRDRIAAALAERSVEIYNATDNKGVQIYAIAIGGQLSQEEARRLASDARAKGVSRDAFAWQSARWNKVAS